MKTRRRIAIVSLVSLAVIIGLAALFHFTYSIEYWVPRQARKYLAMRPEISPVFHEAISNGVVQLGMAPDEAVAAAGPFTYLVNPDLKYGWGSCNMMSECDIRYYFQYAKSPNANPRMAPDIIFRQRTHPDESKIDLGFYNKTQFHSKTPIGFHVVFNKGRAVEIAKND